MDLLIWRTLLLVLFLDRLIFPVACGNHSATVDGPCGNTTALPTVRLDIAYSSSIMENGMHQENCDAFCTDFLFAEFIVMFKDYYSERARTNFINASLSASGMSAWHILPRHNVLSLHPSDFDVIKMGHNDMGEGLDALRDHPTVKRVVPHRKVTRTLSYVDGQWLFLM
jgi:hypothetical protein